MNTKAKMTVAMLALTFGLSACSPQSNDNGFGETRKFFAEAPSPSGHQVFPLALDPSSSLTASIASSIIFGEHPRTFWLADKAPAVLIINGSGYEVSGMTIKPTGRDYLELRNSSIIGNKFSGPAIEIRGGIK